MNALASPEISEIYLTRREAAAYLIEKHGVLGAVTASTLAKLAVLGGGPVMYRFGHRVGYRRPDLDAWVLSRMSGPRRSTSDTGVSPND
jgi:hypothetical protein